MLVGDTLIHLLWSQPSVNGSIGELTDSAKTKQPEEDKERDECKQQVLMTRHKNEIVNPVK